MNRLKHTCRHCKHGTFNTLETSPSKIKCYYPSPIGGPTVHLPKDSCPDWEVKPELKEKVEKWTK